MRSRIFSQSLMVVLFACAAVATAEPVRVIYVDAAAGGAKTGVSWAAAYNCLQDALAAAKGPTRPVEIHVAQGLYKPDQGAGITPGDRAATFKLLNGVTLKGGYAGIVGPDPDARDVNRHETILSGDLAGNDGTAKVTRDPGAPDFPMNENTCNVVTGSGTDNTAVIDGLTITAGSMTSLRPSGSQPLVGGAGMLIEAGSPTVLNCCFVDNYAASKEALLARNGSNPIVTNCTFLNNQGTGMSNAFNSNAILTNCRFEGNAWMAMDNSFSSPVIIGCQFLGNGNGAIRVSDGNSILTDCVFAGNDGKTFDQGISFSSGRATLTGCTFTGFNGAAVEAPYDLTLVRCTFKNNSGFAGRAVRGTSSSRIIAFECSFVRNEGSGAISGGDLELHDCEFIGNSGHQAGAIEGGSERLIATNCVFSGNSGRSGAGAISIHGRVVRLSNCTFAGNRGPCNSLDWLAPGTLPAQLTQCIVQDGPRSFHTRSGDITQISVTYSNVQGGYSGEGNIDVDPCFVDPGYWADPNDPTKEIGPEDPRAVWVAGDYHLKSQGGHWDRATETWMRDEVTSSCIDAGNPNDPLGAEPFPNGGFVNLGAYGGTPEASKSYFGEPVCEVELAGDINGDCRVDHADIDILMMHWLMEGTELINVPPTVTLISPEDGAELTYPTPISCQCVAADPDGTVVWVRYTLEYRTQNRLAMRSTTVTDPANNWNREWAWSDVYEGEAWTIWAEAMDNEGAKTVSPKITVTLHPAK